LREFHSDGNPIFEVKHLNTRSIIKTEGIKKSFSGVSVLKGIDFELYSGEVHCLLGENGAGKSTFIKILSGVYDYDDGNVFFEGTDVVPENPAKMMKLGISTIHQELLLASHLTVAENICLGDLPAENGIVNWHKVMEKANKALRKVNFQIDPKTRVSQLSTANRQLVAIARALSFNSKVIIMDEPTAALSENEVKNLFDIIFSLKKTGVAFIYISHRLAEVFEIGDRVTVLRDGNLVMTEEVKKTNPDTLIKCMVGKDPEQFYQSEEIKVGNPLLEVKNLNNEKLQKVNFVLKEGEILGITGLVGAGKTELAMSLFGSYKNSSGEIIIDGRRCNIRSPMDAIDAGIGLIPEDRRVQALFLQLSVKKNISSALPKEILKWYGVDLKKEEELAKSYIDELYIKTKSPEQKVKFLSGGNQQKVVLARWLSKKLKVYIFDEPTRGLDVGAKSDIYKNMARLAGEGCGVILLSSDLPEIINVSSRILVMYEGKIAAELNPKEATQEKILRYATGHEKS